jgi:hypothetical protein
MTAAQQTAIAYLGSLIAHKKDDVIMLLSRSGIAVLDTSDKAIVSYVVDAMNSNPSFVENVTIYSQEHLSMQNATGFTEKGNAANRFFSNASGSIDWDDCDGHVAGGCYDGDGDFHPSSEIIVSGTEDPASGSGSGNSGGGSNFWSSLGGWFSGNVGTLLTTGLNTWSQGEQTKNQKEILDLQLQIARETNAAKKAELEARKLELQNKKNNSITATNKWIIPLVAGMGVILVGSLVYVILRPKKAA